MIFDLLLPLGEKSTLHPSRGGPGRIVAAGEIIMRRYFFSLYSGGMNRSGTSIPFLSRTLSAPSGRVRRRRPRS